MSKYQAHPGCSFVGPDDPRWKAIDRSAEHAVLSAQIRLPTLAAWTDALIAEHGDWVRLIGMGLTIVVWSDAVPELPAKLTALELDEEIFDQVSWETTSSSGSGHWVHRPAAKRKIHWGAWAGFGGRVPSPDSLIGIYPAEAPACGGDGARQSGGGEEPGSGNRPTPEPKRR